MTCHNLVVSLEGINLDSHGRMLTTFWPNVVGGDGDDGEWRTNNVLAFHPSLLPKFAAHLDQCKSHLKIFYLVSVASELYSSCLVLDCHQHKAIRGCVHLATASAAGVETSQVKSSFNASEGLHFDLNQERALSFC